jgi:uncharacterized SAM-dependent methyltransferase
MVQKRGFVPEKFWYWHEESSILWQKLTSKSSSYEVTAITKKLLNDNADKILNIIKSENKNSLESIDFIDLGVGTPEKDQIVISEIFKHFQDYSKCNIDYFPVDISFPLIEYTIRWILRIKKEHPDQNLKIVPILGDFEKINEADYQTILGENRVKLVALLGNTLGNLIEGEIFQKIHSILGEQGYLLVDVEYSDNIDDDELKKQYHTKEMYDFVFHPLELLGTFTKGTYEQNMFVTVSQPKSDRGFINYHYGKGQSIQVTSIQNSKIIGMFHKNGDQEILMAWSTKYSRVDFEKYLKNWFEPCKSWQEEGKSRYVLYLLKRKNESPVN